MNARRDVGGYASSVAGAVVGAVAGAAALAFGFAAVAEEGAESMVTGVGGVFLGSWIGGVIGCRVALTLRKSRLAADTATALIVLLPLSFFVVGTGLSSVVGLALDEPGGLVLVAVAAAPAAASARAFAGFIAARRPTPRGPDERRERRGGEGQEPFGEKG